jgi:hypothetical protein
MIGQVGADRTARAQIEIIGIAICRNLAIARHRRGDQSEIGQVGMSAIGKQRRLVTGIAIAALRIDESRIAPFLGLGQLGFAFQPVIEFAGEGKEHVPLLFKGFQRFRQRGKALFVILERRLAEHGLEARAITCGQDVVHNLGLVVIGHLDWAEDGNTRLIAAAIDPSIPGETSRRALVGAFIAAILFTALMMLLERVRGLQIFESRHRPIARQIQLLASQLHGQIIGGGEAMIRIMA